MTRDPRHGALDDLIANLERLLSVLETGASANDGTLHRAWTACDEVFARLRDMNEGLPERRLSTEMRERLDHARKLETVAMSLAQRDSDWVSAELGRISGLRSRLKKLGQVPPTGESCDVRA